MLQVVDIVAFVEVAGFVLVGAEAVLEGVFEGARVGVAVGIGELAGAVWEVGLELAGVFGGVGVEVSALACEATVEELALEVGGF